jgi:hypothetical protein
MSVPCAIQNCFVVPTLFLRPLTFRALLEGQYEKLVVFAFYGYFVCYSTLFLGSRRYFYGPWHSIHDLRVDKKNSSFSRFMAILCAIPHYFGVPTLFLRPLTLSTRFEGWHKKLVVFSFYGRFHTVLGPDAICGTIDTWYTIWRATIKTRRFCVIWPFRVLFKTLLWSRRYFYGPWHFVHCLRGDMKNLSFLCFMAV